MKILIVSDSHGDKDIVADAIRIEQPNMVIHAGDIGYEIHQVLDPRYRDYELHYVLGNCDTWLAQYGYPRTATFKIPGAISYSVLLCHGDQYGVKGGNGHLIKAARDAYADIVIYGHTHYQEHAWIDNMLFINPGSIRFGRTYTVLTVDEDGNLDVEESMVPEYYHS